MASKMGLYRPEFEHDACGIGFVANIKGNKNHQIVSDALTILENMEHRGACGCENNTGDGAGILIQTPHEFFFEECLRLGVHLPAFGKYGVGVIFFPKEIRLREECRDIFHRTAEKLGLEVLTWRKVPVNPHDIGPTALSVEPEMEQVFIACPDHLNDPDAFERKLYVLRNHASHIINNTVRKDSIGFYISSLSYKTVVYKGQLTSKQVRPYFPDRKVIGIDCRALVGGLGAIHCITQQMPAIV
jgi:glutamate synthase (NADPH/NADH) large chain